MAPPELTGDAPVAYVLHPVGVDLGEAVGHELCCAGVDGLERLPGERLHLYEPLRGDQRLHVIMAAIAGAHGVAVRLGLDEVAARFKILDDLFAALVAVHAVIRAAILVDTAVVADDADDFQAVAEADLKVVRVMCGRHLDCAGAEIQLHIVVRNDGNLAVHDRQDAGLSDELFKALVVRVHGHAGIAHHGFRAGRRDDEVARAVGQRVADIPEVAGLVHILDLRVGERGDTVGAPVDDTAALVDEALFVQTHEHLAHGPGAALVHGEAGAVPVA